MSDKILLDVPVWTAAIGRLTMPELGQLIVLISERIAEIEGVPSHD